MTSTSLAARVLPPGAGTAVWHLDTLWTFKISSTDTGGAFCLAEQTLPQGSAPPVHRHTREDEAWIVLDGEVTFYLDDQHALATPGTYVYGPRNVPHTFRVESPTARVATLITPGTCEAFFHATGRPAAVADMLPPPAEPDLERLLAGMAAHGIEFVAPPPGGGH